MLHEAHDGAAQAGQGPFPDTGAPTGTPSQPLRVVVADDNPVVRMGLDALLSGHPGIQVVAEAADGREAYELALRHRPDVILLDVRMPGVDGLSALPHLVELAPVMMLTYSREDEIVHEALRRGAGGYVVHGEFTAEQLVSAIRDVRAGRPHFTASPSHVLLSHLRGPASTGHGAGHSDAHHPPTPGGHAYHVPGGTGGFPGPRTPEAGDGASPGEPGSVHGASVRHVGAQQPTPPERSTFALSAREGEIMELIATGMTNAEIASTCFISEKTVKNHINRIFAKLHAGTRSEAVAIWLGTARHGGGAHV